MPLVVPCLLRKEEKKVRLLIYFCGRGIPRWLKVGNKCVWEAWEWEIQVSSSCHSLVFFYIHLVNLTRIIFVTGNIKDSALSVCVANGIPLKMINQAVVCFAVEAPWRDKPATKVIKSSQIHFILLPFKKHEEILDFQDITCICSLCLFNSKNVGPILYNAYSYTLAKSSELNAKALVLNLVFSQTNVLMSCVWTGRFGSCDHLFFLLFFFSQLSLISLYWQNQNCIL